MAIFLIILMPVLPALNQALANHRHAILRGQAQGQATYLALQVRDNLGNAASIVQNMSLSEYSFDNLAYRVTIIPIGGTSRYYSFGNVLQVQTVKFDTEFNEIFVLGGTFIIAEVFDEKGNLVGFSVVKTY